MADLNWLLTLLPLGPPRLATCMHCKTETWCRAWRSREWCLACWRVWLLTPDPRQLRLRLDGVAAE